jgi:pyrroline-5-carboxylate reductase
MKISFIGFGNMAKAMAQGLRKNPSLTLSASAPSLPAGVNVEGINTHFSNTQIVLDADIVILAVKPDQVDHVLTEIKTALPTHCVLISIAAGLSLARLTRLSRPGLAIVRGMPNTPIAVCQGAIALFAGASVSPHQKSQIEALFQALGITAWVNEEEQMNALTALSGSGPAYLYLFLEAIMKGAEQLGLTQTLAESFTLQTMSGAMALLQNTQRSPAELRKKVTSPAGTTAAAVAILQQQGFEQIICSAMQAATKRARELNHTPPEETTCQGC